MSSSSDEDMLALIQVANLRRRRYWVHPVWRAGQESSLFEILGQLEHYHDRFQNTYRMSPLSFSVIMARVRIHLQKQYTNWRIPICPEERLLITLRFFQKFNIPGVIGCVDGTFVSMVRPKYNEQRYYCRKGYHARNVQLITDSDCNILHVDTTSGGGTHDNFVFKQSIIKSHLEQLSNTGERSFLLGDSGYSQRAYLMTPCSNPAPGSEVEYYNKLHSTARNSVERTIGLLKGRFRCLLVHRVLHYDPETVSKIVVACCILHNICNRAGLPAPVLPSHLMQVETRVLQLLEASRSRLRPAAAAAESLRSGRQQRQRLINLLWRSRR